MMDKERIAEIRRAARPGWLTQPHVTIEMLDAIEALDARNAALERWKSEASAVLGGVDLQAIASEIGVPLGRDIGPAILPWIRDAKTEIAALKAQADRDQSEILELQRREPRVRQQAQEDAARGVLQVRATRISPVCFGGEHPHADDPHPVLIGNIWHDSDDVRAAAKKLGMTEVQS